MDDNNAIIDALRSRKSEIRSIMDSQSFDDPTFFSLLLECLEIEQQIRAYYGIPEPRAVPSCGLSTPETTGQPRRPPTVQKLVPARQLLRPKDSNHPPLSLNHDTISTAFNLPMAPEPADQVSGTSLELQANENQSHTHPSTSYGLDPVLVTTPTVQWIYEEAGIEDQPIVGPPRKRESRPFGSATREVASYPSRPPKAQKLTPAWPLVLPQGGASPSVDVDVATALEVALEEASEDGPDSKPKPPRRGRKLLSLLMKQQGIDYSL